MEDLLKPFVSLAKEPGWRIAVQVIDILLVAYIIYRVLALVRGTRALRVVSAILVFILALWFSSLLHLETLNWMLEKAFLLAPVALAILLLPELRQGLDSVAKLGFWTEMIVAPERTQIEAPTIEEIVGAVAEMSASRVGALIVLEKGVPLTEIIENGVQLDAKVSGALLNSIFYEGNPLHDGAVIIRGHTIVAAACRLPLSESSKLDSAYHMRHRAAIGVTEQQDSMVVVVSEERGFISIASEGKLRRLNGPSELRDILNQTFRNQSGSNGQKKKKFAREKQLK